MARKTTVKRKVYVNSRIGSTYHPSGGQQAGLDEFDLQAGREANAMKKMPRRTKKSDTI